MNQQNQPKIAMAAITKHGCELLRQLSEHFPNADLFTLPKFIDNISDLNNNTTAIEGRVADAVGTLFQQYDQLLFIFSIGAAVRMIAPHLRAKESDPGVTVVDDCAKFVIPILSGHIGGANAFAVSIATALGATVVFTTASESRKTLPVDILGRELGWKVEAPKVNLVRVAAHVVNDEPIAVVQECGSDKWWPEQQPLPENIQRFSKFEQIDCDNFRGILWITQREVAHTLWQQLAEKLIVYRPPVA